MAAFRSLMLVSVLAAMPLVSGCIVIGGGGGSDRVVREVREVPARTQVSNRAATTEAQRMPTAAELSSMVGLMRTMAANMPAGPDGRRPEIPADALPNEAQMAAMIGALTRAADSPAMRDMAARQANRPAGSMPTEADMAVMGQAMGQMMGAMSEAGFGHSGAAGTHAVRAAPTVEALTGNWNVSLRPDASAPPSATTMQINAISNDVASGSFYGSAFDNARVTQDGNDVLITATTADQSGQYIHSGRLRRGVIEGQTLSVGRNFLMPWTATKAQ